MSRKPLSAVSLPSGALAALTRAGYNTVEDVLSSNAEAVSEGFQSNVVFAKEKLTHL